MEKLELLLFLTGSCVNEQYVKMLSGLSWNVILAYEFLVL